MTRSASPAARSLARRRAGLALFALPVALALLTSAATPALAGAGKPGDPAATPADQGPGRSDASAGHTKAAAAAPVAPVLAPAAQVMPPAPAPVAPAAVPAADASNSPGDTRHATHGNGNGNGSGNGNGNGSSAPTSASSRAGSTSPASAAPAPTHSTNSANSDCGNYCHQVVTTSQNRNHIDGSVGNADNKNPKGQRTNGSDHNNGYECDGNPGIGNGNPAHTGCTPAPQPTNKLALRVDKTNDANRDGTFTKDEVAPRSSAPVTFHLVITNTGEVTVVLTSVVDAWPGHSLQPCRLATLRAGESTTCRFTVNGYAPAAGSALQNVATVLAREEHGSRTTSGSDTSVVHTPASPPPPARPDVKIVKTGPAQAVRPGELLAYTLLVTNTGSVPATGVVVDDPLAAGLTLVSASSGCSGTTSVHCIVGTVAVGQSVAVQVVVRLSDPFVGDAVRNTATVGPADDTMADNVSSWTVPVRHDRQPTPPPADVKVVKTGPDNAVHPGDQLTYTLTVLNTGTVAASGFTVSDQLPQGLSLIAVSGGGFTCASSGISCVANSPLLAGGQVAVTVTALLDLAFDKRFVSNTAVVTLAGDLTPEDNTDTVTTPVAPLGSPAPDLAITKTASSATVFAGGQVTYRLTVSNTGTVPASGFTVADPLPDGLTLVSISGNAGFACDAASGRCRFTGNLTGGASTSVSIVATTSAGSAGSSIVNVATVTPTDASPGDNSAMATISVPLTGVTGGPGSGTPPLQPGTSGRPNGPGSVTPHRVVTGITGRPGSPATGGPNQPGGLPFTGSQAGLLFGLTGWLLLAGTVLSVIGRRRLRSRRTV